MNYRKVHDSIIKRGRLRKLKGYVERHHIKPKCIGGEDIDINLVELTAKEHYLIHKLLVEIYPKEDCLKYAYWMMSHRVDGTYVGGKIYSQTRSFITSKFRKNVGTPDAIKKMAKSRKGQKLWEGKKHTKETKLKMRKAALTRTIVPENEAKRREGISKNNKGKKLTKKHKDKLRDSKLGSNNPMFGRVGVKHHRSKIVVQSNLENEFIKEWPNAKLAAEELQLSYQAINLCCNNKIKTSGGFIWKFKQK